MLREGYTIWRFGGVELSLARPRIMGILNVTPDSFSDGGNHATPDDALAYAMQMLDEGADIIDVGGESTRPGHTPLDPQTEAERIIPVVRGLVAEGALVSVDTRHPEVARMCVRLGAHIVNDVSGFRNPEMVKVAADTSCGCIVMHWDQQDAVSSVPRKRVLLDTDKAHAASSRVGSASSQRRFTLPEEAPIMRQVMGFLGDQARILMRAGVSHDRICIDPGPGFDKAADEDVVIQRATHSMVSMGYPLLCAVSRKRFVGAVSGVATATDRDPATHGICISAIQKGAHILRVHDVKGTAQSINAYWSVAKKDLRQGFISLGSNVGDRLNNLTRAIQLIDQIPLTCVVSASHAYESEPAYGIATPVANAVAEIRTELHPLVLLDHLMQVESKLGRTRTTSSRDSSKPGSDPRLIDCDLVWLEGEIHSGQRLRLPHPRLGERDYVLIPMEDLMHDPVRFLTHGGVHVLPREQRVGHVRSDLGELAWQL